MSDLEKYNEIFMNNFRVDKSILNKEFTSDKVENWDSLAHLQLVAELEETFDIMFDTDDIFELTSYDKGKDILKKYEIILER